MDTPRETHELAMAERDRLVAAIGSITEADWHTPSLCRGWTVRDTTVHLLMPYELGVATMLFRLARSRFHFDKVADTWAREDTRTPGQLVAALGEIDTMRFGAPGVPQVAALSHLVCHGGDIYRPLGIEHVVATQAATIVLNELVGRGRRSLPEGILEARRFSAIDVDWDHGTGPEISGTAAALITTLLGRADALDELTGTGTSDVRALIESH